MADPTRSLTNTGTLVGMLISVAVIAAAGAGAYATSTARIGALEDGRNDQVVTNKEVMAELRHHTRILERLAAKAGVDPN